MNESGRSDPFASRRVWSMREMLEKHASLFVTATLAFSEAKWVAVHTEREGVDSPESRKQIANLGHHALHRLRHACILSDLDEVVPELDRLAQSFNLMLDSSEYKLNVVGQAIKHLLSRIQDELSSQHYFHMDQRDVPLYGKKELFGPKVSKKFANNISDIENAGSCLALQQPTACVFHLMRLMERAVQRFGKKLKVDIDPRVKSWSKIVDHINAQINKLPGKTEAEKRKRAKYASAAAYLNEVRLAWRNEVMHLRWSPNFGQRVKLIPSGLRTDDGQGYAQAAFG